MRKKSNIKVRLYPLIARAVEEGVAYGWNRAHKHTETTSEFAIKNEIAGAVLNQLCELIEFD